MPTDPDIAALVAKLRAGILAADSVDLAELDALDAILAHIEALTAELAAERGRREELLAALPEAREKSGGGLECGPDFEVLYMQVRKAYLETAMQLRAAEARVKELTRVVELQRGELLARGSTAEENRGRTLDAEARVRELEAEKLALLGALTEREDRLARVRAETWEEAVKYIEAEIVSWGSVSPAIDALGDVAHEFSQRAKQEGAAGVDHPQAHVDCGAPAAPSCRDALSSLLAALEDVPVAFGVHVHDAVAAAERALAATAPTPAPHPSQEPPPRPAK